MLSKRQEGREWPEDWKDSNSDIETQKCAEMNQNASVLRREVSLSMGRLTNESVSSSSKGVELNGCFFTVLGGMRIQRETE